MHHSRDSRFTANSPLPVNKMNVSPLCPQGSTRAIRSISSNYLIERWRAAFDIDISEVLDGTEAITENVCDTSGLRFFTPLGIDAPAALYEYLQRLPWYYTTGKWEHQYTLDTFASHGSLLEVGCGTGHFLQCAKGAGWPEVIGIELNREAAEVARSQGLEVLTTDLASMTPKYEKHFSLCCAFQVLEHVREPVEFMRQLAEVTCPGGMIVIGVPNPASLVGSDGDNILDMPPHHMTRWPRSAFVELASVCGLRLRSVTCEPLAEFHVRWHSELLMKRFVPKGLGGRIRARLRSVLCSALRSPVVRRRVAGHTHVASFQRPARDKRARGIDHLE